MSQEQRGLKKMSGIIDACGFLTMSSSIATPSFTTMQTVPAYYSEIFNFSLTDHAICNSSMLSKRALGDIVSMEKKTDFVQQHEKTKVNLQITKIKKHISNFEFEEEYEEI